MRAFIVPRVRNTATNLDVGFAVVNTGSTDATVDVSVRSASNQILASKSVVLKSKEQIATFAYLFFEGTLHDPPGASYSSLIFRSTGPQLAATALMQGPTLSSVPVEQIQ